MKADKLKDAVRRWQQKSTKAASNVSSPGSGLPGDQTNTPPGSGMLRISRPSLAPSTDYGRQVTTQTHVPTSGIVAAVKAAAAEGSMSVSTGPANFTGPLPFTEIMRLKKEGRAKPTQTSASRSSSPRQLLRLLLLKRVRFQQMRHSCRLECVLAQHNLPARTQGRELSLSH